MDNIDFVLAWESLNLGRFSERSFETARDALLEIGWTEKEVAKAIADAAVESKLRELRSGGNQGLAG